MPSLHAFTLGSHPDLKADNLRTTSSSPAWFKIYTMIKHIAWPNPWLPDVNQMEAFTIYH